MGMKSSIKQSGMPAVDDLEGWKRQVEILTRLLEMAEQIVNSLQSEESEPEPERDLEDEG